MLVLACACSGARCYSNVVEVCCKKHPSLALVVLVNKFTIQQQILSNCELHSVIIACAGRFILGSRFSFKQSMYLSLSFEAALYFSII